MVRSPDYDAEEGTAIPDVLRLTVIGLLEGPQQNAARANQLQSKSIQTLCLCGVRRCFGQYVTDTTT